MKRFISGVLIAASIALSGCAVAPGGINGASSSVALQIDRAIGSADSAYVAAYQIGAQRVRDGKMSRADFLTYEAIAYDAILLMRSAKTIADLTVAQAQLAQATAKLNQ